MLGYAHLLAHVEHGAGRASREPTSADMFPEGHEEAVDLDPVAARELCFERVNRFFRRRGMDVTPTIRDPVYMHVNADVRLTAGYPEYQVGALGAYAFQR